MNKKGFQEGEWEFTFPNEDKYSGHYNAHVSGLAWRQGPGLYVTHDGQTYEGNWKEDKLNEAENLKVTYQNEDQYTGKILKYKYNGPGTYTFKNGSHLTSNFTNNKPSGDIIYIDYHGQLWYGKAEAEYSLLSREHIFSYELDSERGKGRPKRALLELTDKLAEIVEPEEIIEKESVDLKELENEVFAKSTKTPSEINFEDSDWFREFQNFTETRKTVLHKIATEGVTSLTPEEKAWYRQYLKSVKLLERKKHKKLVKINADLLKQYFEEQLKDTCPPTSVFYPGEYWQTLGE